jgi:hypothetical protein
MTDTPDTLSFHGAALLAAQLDEFWRRSGARHVRHWVEPDGVDRTSKGGAEGRVVWGVRSNLVRGNAPPVRRA